MAVTQIHGGQQIRDLTITGAKLVNSTVTDAKLASGAEFLKRNGSVAWTADNSAGGFKLTNLADGVNPNDAVTKLQLDTVASGISVKNAARVATTANITIASDLNVGDVIDGVTLASGDRVLVKNQTTASQNGVYVAGATPARAIDFDGTPLNEVQGGNLVPVQLGTVNSNTQWIIVGTGNRIVDTDDVDFTQFSGAGTQTSSNVGGGAQVFKQLVGNNFEFRSLLDSAEINTDQNTNDITFSIVNASITGSKIANTTITDSNITNDTITAAKLQEKEVYEEIPTGSINGSNLVFTIANTPVTGKLRVFVNGIRQRSGSGNDYTISGTTLTFETGNAPQSGDSLIVDYKFI